MKTALPNTILARGLLILLMAVTLLPFLAMFTAALAPRAAIPMASSGRPIRNGAISSGRSKSPRWISSSSRAR